MLEATLERAREVLDAAPVSVAILKRLLWRGLSASLAERGTEESLMLGWTSSQADAQEGVASFFEKRESDWKLSVAKNTSDVGL